MHNLYSLQLNQHLLDVYKRQVINETKENQEKEDDTEETEDVLEGIEIEDDSDVDKTETINLEEI